MVRDRRSSPPVGLAVGVAAVAAVTGANYGLREIAPAVSTGVVYLLAVLLVSSGWGLWLGLVTSFLSAAAFGFFHIPPTGRFTIAEGENLVALAVFFVAAVVTSTLADAARSRAEEAEHRRLEADLSAEMARQLLGEASIDEALGAVGQGIARAFGLESVSIEPNWVDGDERRTAMALLVGGSRVGTVLVPRDADSQRVSVIQNRVVPTLATLVDAAKRREQLASQVVETKALRRSDDIKTTLLRAVSHDLRSPLTAITAAAGGLTSGTLSEDARAELASVVAGEGARLSRLVDNLLDLSRLQAGGAEPRLDWCSIEEVVGAVVESVQPPPAGFDVKLDRELPLIEADATQLDRALANVLENSARFAGDQPVAVRAHATGRSLVLRVSDRGPGIPKAELERIFEPFHRAAERTGGGAGLGLAIARGFLESNGGTLRAESLPGKGASFVFRLVLPAGAETLPEPAERPAS